jgi:hypothetical protein
MEYLDEARDFARRMMEGKSAGPVCHSHSANPDIFSLGRRACSWCNTRPEERRPGATDHGGI